MEYLELILSNFEIVSGNTLLILLEPLNSHLIALLQFHNVTKGEISRYNNYIIINKLALHTI